MSSTLFLTACSTSTAARPSTDAWESLIEWFATMIQFLSPNGHIGIGIILFTLLIRTVLLPLFHIQIKSSQKMQELQPQLRLLQETYAGTDMDSRQKLYEETQKLYRANGVSLRSSMLPLLIQMPILLALFQALTRVEALKSGNFLWLHLGQPDPYLILPILAALLTFVSSWLANKAALEKNPAMTIMTYAMPALIFFIALSSASGVALYWTVSNAYQVAQTLILNNPFAIIAARKAQKVQEKERHNKIKRAQKKARRQK